MKPGRVLVVLAASIFAASASAQDLKPGLWEVSNKMQSASGEMEKAAAQMQQQMASMPPEQRKMMEEMMAKQGVRMGTGPGETTARICMTKEMVERSEVPAQQGHCTTTSQPRTGNTVKMAFTCTDPPSSGDGLYTIVSPEAYTMTIVLRSSAQGKPTTMNMAGSGKWLGADCGNIEPMQLPAAK